MWALKKYILAQHVFSRIVVSTWQDLPTGKNAWLPWVYLLTRPALPLGELGGCLGRCAKEGTKNVIVWLSKWRTCIKKGNELDESEWNTRSCSLWEDKDTTLFQVCCRRVNIFLINFNFTYTKQAMSQFGINFIHVINFSNVQNVLRISVMYVMSRVRIFV